MPLCCTKLQTSATFLRDRYWFFTHVFNVPLPNRQRFFFFFCRKNVGSLNWRPKIYGTKIKKKNKYLEKSTNRTLHSLTVRQGHIMTHVCTFSRYYLSKTAWTFGHSMNLGRQNLNQPVLRIIYQYPVLLRVTRVIPVYVGTGVWEELTTKQRWNHKHSAFARNSTGIHPPARGSLWQKRQPWER